MKPPDEVTRQLVRQWVAKADEDRNVTQKLPYDDPQCLAPIAYHAQQCAEKFLKAFLVLHGIEFTWTHDLRKLLDLIAGVDAALASSLAFAEDLTRFASETRYPVLAPSAPKPAVTEEKARNAVELAEKVREIMLKVLPT